MKRPGGRREELNPETSISSTEAVQSLLGEFIENKSIMIKNTY